MPNYITAHHGGGWKYQHHIPVALRPMLGGKSAFVRYIKRMPRREAEAIARKYAWEDAAALSVCLELTEKNRAIVVAYGGLPAILNADIPTSPEDERFEKAQHTPLYW